ncbi:hypothetical protein [uncultured Olsenella sp.]|uniref:hypothetical protein n=1 Tax=uncultured Olsenella sp. TaxID=190764 RepID=UPI0026DDC77E|nr:hypothetical protein [uncultured Olsenella sp.]
MSAISYLRAQERLCLSRIEELTCVLDSLSDFRAEVARSSDRFRDQLAYKANVARRAGGISGMRTARRYAEHTVGYLTGELDQVMSAGFFEVDAQASVATLRAEAELDEERARLSSIRAEIASERARERAEAARREAEGRLWRTGPYA